MYVCLCRGITDGQIKDAIDKGADTMAKLRKTLDVAGQCGKCGIMTRQILEETLAANVTQDGFPLYYAVA